MAQQPRGNSRQRPEQICFTTGGHALCEGLQRKEGNTAVCGAGKCCRPEWQRLAMSRGHRARLPRMLVQKHDCDGENDADDGDLDDLREETVEDDESVGEETAPSGPSSRMPGKNRKFESIFDLPRVAVEMDDVDGLEPPMSEDQLVKITGKAPPSVRGYNYRGTPNIDWRYWQNAGPRIDGVHCPGCGQIFQTEDPKQLGYIPAHKLENLPTAEEQEMRGPVLCARCHSLRYKRDVDADLTVEGAVKRAEVPAELAVVDSENVLKKLRGKKCVVLYLVDVVDFNGTCLDLTRIVGTMNPVIVGINKCDLLPRGFSESRVKDWVVQESKKHGLVKVYDVHMISSLKGHGVKAMLNQAYGLARRGKCDLFVVGAANVGKSSFINELLQCGWQLSGKPIENRKLLTTTSQVPGTTLSMFPIGTGDGLTIYDSPGVVLPHNLTTYLRNSELRYVLPSTKLATHGLRFQPGQSLLFGGLALIDFVEGNVLLANWFCADQVKVHLRDTSKVEEFLEKNVGTPILQPPVGPDAAADLKERWTWQTTTLEVKGDSWQQACKDVVIAGLGWVSITVRGTAVFRVRVPEGVRVCTRSPLLPYEAVFGAARFTGGKWVNGYKDEFLARERRKQGNAKKKTGKSGGGPFPDLERDRTRNFRGFKQ